MGFTPTQASLLGVAILLSWYLRFPLWKLLVVVLVSYVLLRLGKAIKAALRDPYFSDYHLSLNDLQHGHRLGEQVSANSDDGTDERRDTEWINMGYWKVRRIFIVSCI